MRSRTSQPVKSNNQNESQSNDLPNQITKRDLLKKASATAVGLTGLTGMSMSGTASKTTLPEYCIGGNYGERNWNTVDIVVVNKTSQRSPGGPATAVLNGFCDGFEKLYNQCSWFDGYRIRLKDPGGSYNGDNDRDELKTALDDDGLTDDLHYHVVYDGSLTTGSYHNTLDSAWGSNRREISGLSLATTNAGMSPPYIRGLHQALHNYIEDEVAHNKTDNKWDDAYDAKHALGVITDTWIQIGRGGSYVRSIMADQYVIEADRLPCRDMGRGGNPGHNTYPSEKILFSDCTKDALYTSALKKRPSYPW